MRVVVVLAIVCIASVANGGVEPLAASQLAGTWVTADVKRALDAGTPTAVGCRLSIVAQPLAVDEICGDEREAWAGPIEASRNAGRIELAGTGRRRIVSRAGTPNARRTQDGLRRLYRIGAAQGELVAEWERTAAAPPRPGDGDVETDDADGAALRPAARPAKGRNDSPPAVRAVAETPVPIAQPIIPKGRACGCSAAEGGLAAAGILVALGWRPFRGRRGARPAR